MNIPEDNVEKQVTFKLLLNNFFYKFFFWWSLVVLGIRVLVSLIEYFSEQIELADTRLVRECILFLIPIFLAGIMVLIP